MKISIYSPTYQFFYIRQGCYDYVVVRLLLYAMRKISTIFDEIIWRVGRVSDY